MVFHSSVHALLHLTSSFGSRKQDTISLPYFHFPFPSLSLYLYLFSFLFLYIFRFLLLGGAAWSLPSSGGVAFLLFFCVVLLGFFFFGWCCCFPSPVWRCCLPSPPLGVAAFPISSVGWCCFFPCLLLGGAAWSPSSFWVELRFSFSFCVG